MANPNAYKGSSKNKSSFVKGIKQAQKRNEAKKRQRQMIAAEELKKANKKHKKNK